MLSILLDHTEIYYTGGNLIPYDWYVSNVLIVFFFLGEFIITYLDRSSLLVYSYLDSI